MGPWIPPWQWLQVSDCQGRLSGWKWKHKFRLNQATLSLLYIVCHQVYRNQEDLLSRARKPINYEVRSINIWFRIFYDKHIVDVMTCYVSTSILLTCYMFDDRMITVKNPRTDVGKPVSWLTSKYINLCFFLQFPDLETFVTDMQELCAFIADGPLKSFCFQRLSYLQSKYELAKVYVIEKTWKLFGHVLFLQRGGTKVPKLQFENDIRHIICILYFLLQKFDRPELGINCTTSSMKSVSWQSKSLFLTGTSTTCEK